MTDYRTLLGVLGNKISYTTITDAVRHKDSRIGSVFGLGTLYTLCNAVVLNPKYDIEFNSKKLNIIDKYELSNFNSKLFLVDNNIVWVGNTQDLLVSKSDIVMIPNCDAVGFDIKNDLKALYIEGDIKNLNIKNSTEYIDIKNIQLSQIDIKNCKYVNIYSAISSSMRFKTSGSAYINIYSLDANNNVEITCGAGTRLNLSLKNSGVWFHDLSKCADKTRIQLDFCTIALDNFEELKFFLTRAIKTVKTRESDFAIYIDSLYIHNSINIRSRSTVVVGQSKLKTHGWSLSDSQINELKALL